MNAFLKKVQRACQELESEKGKFSLLAFVELAANQNEWDVVVCADWLPKRKRAAIDIMSDKLEKFLDEDDFLTLSGVIILNKEDSFYCELKKLVKENTPFMGNVVIDGLDVKQIHILQFQPNETAASQSEQTFLSLLKSNPEFSNYIDKIVEEKIAQRKSADYLASTVVNLTPQNTTNFNQRT